MNKSFFTVGIGASAGGLAALKEFFDHLSPDLNIAVIVVTHLFRERRSIMGEILARHTHFPVIRVEEDMPIYPKNVYVLVENTTMATSGCWLRVKVRDEKIKNNAVDVLFESLANNFKEKAVGIILSGGGNDGLKGALKINQYGGKIIVQDPQSAEFTGMPLSILASDHPTAIMRPSELAVYLNKICFHLEEKHDSDLF